MNDAKNILNKMSAVMHSQSTTATQGVKLEQPEISQLHVSKEQLKQCDNAELQDFFFLITKVNSVTCEVIPGSFDGIMAGPDDIILPKEVLGQYVYLSLNMRTEVPINALADGFAVLDNECYQRILASCQEFANGTAGEIPSYPRAMPYISDFDDRIAYHKKQQRLIQIMQMCYRKQRPLKFPLILKAGHLYKVAGVLLVGALSMFMYLYNTPKSVPPSFREITPSGVLRGGETNSVAVYSPRNLISTDQPKIAIGGETQCTYLVTVYDTDDKEIATKKLAGQSIIPWTEFSNTSLSADEIYKLEVKSGRKIIISKDTNIFYLLPRAEKTTLMSELRENNTPVTACGKSRESFDDDFFSSGQTRLTKFSIGCSIPSRNLTIPEAFGKAKILYKHGCYSEAYLEVTKLLETDKENKKYLMFQRKCLEKLGIQITQK